MSKKLLVGCLLLILIVASACISFQATAIHSIGGGNSYLGGKENDGAYSIAVTSDKGFVIAGYTNSSGAGGADFWLLKYGPTTMNDPLNRTITYAGQYWDKTYGGQEDDVAKCVIVTADGGFAMVGYTISSVNGSDVWLVKTDSAGNMEWNATYNGVEDEAANSLVQTEDGGYLLSGYVASNGQSKNTLVIKTNGLGTMEWNRTLPGQGCNSVTTSIDGTYALAVTYPSAFGLLTIDASGSIVFNMTYSNSADLAQTQSVIQADDGGYVIAGWTQNNSTGARETWLVKTDSDGVIQWDRTCEKLGSYSIIKTIDGDYALTGDRASIIITDSNGNLLLEKTNDGETGDAGRWFTRTYSITETIENHFYMVGTSNAAGESVKYQAILTHSVLASDDTLPAVTVLSPENGKTYQADNVPLTVYVNKTTMFLWYSLDGQNATISGNTTLPTLADGSHNITVYARDTAYNIGTSEPVFFSSETIQFTIGRSLNTAPPPDSTTTKDDNNSKTSDPTQLIKLYSAAFATAATVVFAIVYSVKHRAKSPPKNSDNTT